MNDTDLLREALDELRREIRLSSLRLAEYVTQNGDDPVAYALADKIFASIALEKRYRRLLLNEESLA